MQMFKVNSYSDTIVELCVAKETDKTVSYVSERRVGRAVAPDVWESVYKEPRRIDKATGYHRVFKTIEEAVEFIRDRYKTEIKNHERGIELARKQLNDFNAQAKVLLALPK